MVGKLRSLLAVMLAAVAEGLAGWGFMNPGNLPGGTVADGTEYDFMCSGDIGLNPTEYLSSSYWNLGGYT